MLDELDSEPDSLPLEEPDPDELSRFLCDARRSARSGGGEIGFFRFNDTGEIAFLSRSRERTVETKVRNSFSHIFTRTFTR